MIFARKGRRSPPMCDLGMYMKRVAKQSLVESEIVGFSSETTHNIWLWPLVQFWSLNIETCGQEKSGLLSLYYPFLSTPGYNKMEILEEGAWLDKKQSKHASLQIRFIPSPRPLYTDSLSQPLTSLFMSRAGLPFLPFWWWRVSLVSLGCGLASSYKDMHSYTAPSSGQGDEVLMPIAPLGWKVKYLSQRTLFLPVYFGPTCI